MECPSCSGKGGFDLWNKPCMEGGNNFKLKCNTCLGRCVINRMWTKCNKCNGLGGFDIWEKPCR